MKKILALISLLVSSALSAAPARACVDLSHVAEIGGLPLQVKQIGCDRWVYQQTTETGDPVGDPWERELTGKWEVTHVDDAYEITENRQRWTWNRDQTALTHDYVIDTFSKSAQTKIFSTASEIFRLGESQVSREGQHTLRLEEADGNVTVTSQPLSGSYPRLK